MDARPPLFPRLSLPVLALGLALIVGFLSLLAACGMERGPGPGESRAQWAEAGLLYLADQRNGQVRVFRLRGDLPVWLETLALPQRRSIRGLDLDAAGERLWVLDVAGLSLYDARSRVLLGHWAAPAGVRLEGLETLATSAVAVAAGGGRFVPGPGSTLTGGATGDVLRLAKAAEPRP